MRDLTPYVLSESEHGHPCWNLGSIKIEKSDAKIILGEPHYVERDTFATGGGTEEHWAFSTKDGVKIFFRLRVPYSQLDVHVIARIIPAESWRFFSDMFTDYVFTLLDAPFNEMGHPDDPASFYPVGKNKGGTAH